MSISRSPYRFPADLDRDLTLGTILQSLIGHIEKLPELSHLTLPTLLGRTPAECSAIRTLGAGISRDGTDIRELSKCQIFSAVA